MEQQNSETFKHLFEGYKESCRIRLEACGDNKDLKIVALESMVTELMEQNELLLNSLIELQKDTWSIPDKRTGGQRLTQSNRCSDDVLKTLDKYGAEVEKMVCSKLSQIDSADAIQELNNHLTILKSENEMLRGKNDNLQHDLGNLLEMVNFCNNFSNKSGDHNGSSSSGSSDAHEMNKSAKSSLQTSLKHLTFCDSVKPEDVFGPIESLKDFSPTDEPEIQSSSGRNSDVTSNHSVTQTLGHQSSKGTKCSLESNSSIGSSNQLQNLEEKELLIESLQKHLEHVSQQMQLNDDVIKRIETKLDMKRKECMEWKNRSQDLEKKLNESVRKYLDLKGRELLLIDQKKGLMVKLNEETDSSISMKEELNLLRKRIKEVTKTSDYQAMTIEHLKGKCQLSRVTCSDTCCFLQKL